MRAARAALRLIVLFLALGLAPSPARSQAAYDAQAASVASRPRPGIDPQGVSLGSFQLYPSLDVAVNYDDNIYNRNDRVVSDVSLSVRPALEARSRWDRNSVQLRAYGTFERYRKHRAENSNQYGVALNGYYDLGSAYRLTYSAEAARAIEPRGTEGDVLLPGGPNAYWRTGLSGSLIAKPGRFLVSLSGHWARFTYLDNRGPNGPIDLSSRDYVAGGGSLRVGYEVGAGIYAFGEGAYTAARYPRDTNDDRNSRGYAVHGGIQLNASRLLGGSIRAGYLQQRFNGAARSDVRGFDFQIDLFWNPTELLSVRVNGGRSVQRSPLAAASAVADTDLDLIADYELLRRVLLGATVERARSDFRGIARTEVRYSEALTVRYNLNRFLDLTARLGLGQRHSSEPGRNYSETAFRVGVIGRF